MSPENIIDISHTTIMTVIETSAPLLVVSLIIGLIVSILQTITSLQEQTLTFVPKFIAIMLILMLCGSWIMNKVATLLVDIMEQIPSLIK